MPLKSKWNLAILEFEFASDLPRPGRPLERMSSVLFAKIAAPRPCCCDTSNSTLTGSKIEEIQNLDGFADRETEQGGYETCTDNGIRVREISSDTSMMGRTVFLCVLCKAILGCNQVSRGGQVNG